MGNLKNKDLFSLDPWCLSFLRPFDFLLGILPCLPSARAGESSAVSPKQNPKVSVATPADPRGEFHFVLCEFWVVKHFRNVPVRNS